jgi:ABC-type lipoprotein export system ATPase subunit
MNIKSHVNFLLNEYNLNSLYYKFISTGTMNSLLRESFYWTLIYFSIKLESKQHIKKVAVLLLGILFTNVPLENLANIYRIELIDKLKNANSDYFIKKLQQTGKKDILGIDLVNYYNTIYSINSHIKEYIINKKLMGDIPITFVSVLIIILSKGLGNDNTKGKILLTSILVIFFMLIIYLNEQEIKKELLVLEESIEYENHTREYIINSKTSLMNDNFNNDYYKEKMETYNSLCCKMDKMDNNLVSISNYSIFVVFSLIISYFIDKITPPNMIKYFLVVYDIDMISNKIRNFYKNKMSYDKMGVKLNLLNSILNTDNLLIEKNTNKINNITIKKINNKKPELNLKSEIIINNGDHILVDGVSGSGKTTLLYFLKGIKYFDSYEIQPDIKKIHSRCYISLPNERDLFSANINDIVSNFQKNPEKELIKSAIKIVNLDKYIDKIDKNEFIKIETLSAGESTRFMIARLIYQIKINNCYDILLFDEIDSNLNIKLSQEICLTLRDIFKDKIILYITHNDEVKDLFSKKIIVKNGTIDFKNQ